MPRSRLVAPLLVALLGLLVVFGARVQAQSATPAAGTMTGQALIGAWILDTNADNPSTPPTLASFSADGIYTQVEQGNAVGIGAWTATGPATANLTFHELVTDPKGDVVGYFTVRAAVTVAADGQTLTATYTLEYPAGNGQTTGQYGPGRVTGIRVGVEAMGTPVGPLSVLESQGEGGGATPAATPGG